MNTLKEWIRPYYLRCLYFPLRPGVIPPSFVRCWQYPFTRMDDDSVSLLNTDTRGNIIFYPMNDWHTRIQRSQQLARSISALSYNCLYINPHLGRQFESLPHQDSKHRLSTLGDHLYELHVRLPREPVFHHRNLTVAESRIVSRAIESLIPPSASLPGLQIISLPIWLNAAMEIREKYGYPIVYDCHDLLEGFSDYSPDIHAAETDLFNKADKVIFSSNVLLERYTAANPELKQKSIVLRNAVDESLLNHPRTKPLPAKRNVIGYIGAIQEWFDVDAIRLAALSLPDQQFLLYGKAENSLALKNLQLPNVRLMGEVEFSDVARVLSEFDVGLIPFVVNDLTLSTNPIKIYEYFAFGIPVVSAALPEVTRFGDLVYIADSPAAFARQARTALLEQSGTLESRRREIASRETWGHRALGLLELMPDSGAT